MNKIFQNIKQQIGQQRLQVALFSASRKGECAIEDLLVSRFTFEGLTPTRFDGYDDTQISDFVYDWLTDYTNGHRLQIVSIANPVYDYDHDFFTVIAQVTDGKDATYDDIEITISFLHHFPMIQN